MLDIKLVRNNPEIIINDLEKRKNKDKIKILNETIKLDSEKRELFRKKMSRMFQY